MLEHSPLHRIVNGLVLLCVLWLIGLFLFVRDVAEWPKGDITNVKKVDGLVVLTGGTERMEAGLDLFAKNLAPRLMISGVDPRADKKNIIPARHPAKAREACCITFGTYAEDTIGNAREAASWVEHYKMQSLMVITSNYHMRRAMLEFSQALPSIILIPYVVESDRVKLDHWWENAGTAALLLREYNKYLLALVKAGLHHLFKDAPKEENKKS